jgi:DNA adenine methylase
VTLSRSDFSNILASVQKHKHEAASTFVYFDPPYRPLSATASFTAYSKSEFGEVEQRALAAAFKSLHRLGVKVMLSNSDPKNEDPSDNFFSKLYEDKAFTIRQVPARRMINSRADRRGRLNELVITNY